MELLSRFSRLRPSDQAVPMIDPEDHLPRQQLHIVGRSVSLIDVGVGSPILFIHGNVTYSYSWRNIIPFLSRAFRCIAPDLLGMGASELIRPSGPGAYRYEDHVDTLDLLLEILDLRGVTVVGHEMGASFAIELARRHPSTVRGLILIEGVLRVSNDETFDPEVRKFLQRVRSEEGDTMVLHDNALIDQYLPRLTQRALTPAELRAYRQPVPIPGEARRAMLSMIRELPLRSYPGPLNNRIEENRLWCAQSEIPKLVIGGKPGFLITPAILGTTARWRNTRVASVPGLHFLTEDSPSRITSVMLDWLERGGPDSELEATRP